MRLIDADSILTQAWQNFYKQEDEHEKQLKDYDILRDRHYEQKGFECCQQTIVNAPTVEAIPISVLENIKTEIENIKTYSIEGNVVKDACLDLIDKHISGEGKHALNRCR